jgi:lipooligosaccharide transport system permease protein
VIRVTAPAIRVVEHNVVTFRRIWRSYLVSVVTPLLFLTVFGTGVGRLIDRSGELHGPYLSFLAPGLLVGTAMQNGALAGFGPVMGRIRWDPIYESMLHSPLRLVDLLVGELMWIVLRLTVTCGVFLAVVMMMFGASGSWWVLLCWPVAVLTGLAFAAVFMAVAGRAPNGYAYDVLSRVVIIPLFMFGGVFFPVQRLPAPLRWVVELTPIGHGTALARAVITGASSGAVLLHVAVLAGYTIGGFMIAAREFKRRLSA